MVVLPEPLSPTSPRPNGPGGNHEVDAVDGADAAEPHLQVADFEQVRHAGALRLAEPRHRRHELLRVRVLAVA